VAEERMVRVEISNEDGFDAVVSPGEIKFFIYGHLFTEGYVEGIDEILDYVEHEKGGTVLVRVRITDERLKRISSKKNYSIIHVECGSGTGLQRRGEVLKGFQNDFRITTSEILNILAEVNNKNEFYRKTGAFHYAFIFDEGLRLLEYSHDIGRHNAVDKAMGKILLKGTHTGKNVLFTTGRVTSSLVLKALRARVPLVVSRGAALEGAVSIARRYNMGLVGFLRRKRFNVYHDGGILEY